MSPSSSSSLHLLGALLTTTVFVAGLRFDPREADWNLNTNQRATNPLDYDGRREDGFKYTKSPNNWRVPFYTIFLDRFVNGDPENDDKNGTAYETDMMSTQIRFGGDLEGLRDSLDYIAGMGIKVCRVDSQIRGQGTFSDKRVLGVVHCRVSVHQPPLGRRRILGNRPSLHEYSRAFIELTGLPADRLNPSRQTLWHVQALAKRHR